MNFRNLLGHYRVLSRIQDHNKPPDRAHSSRVDDVSQSPAQINGRSLPVCQARIERQRKKGGIAVGGPPERSSSSSSSLAVAVRSTRENTPQWAKSLLLAQKASDVRLEKLKKVAKNHRQKPSDESLSGHKFEKKLYEEQHDFNLKVLRHLQNVASLDSSVGIDEIEAGTCMFLIKERNKFLVLADSFEWDIALCYTGELLAEDSENERNILRPKKEGKIRRDERFKSKLKPRRRYSAPVRGFPPSGPSIGIMCLRCKRPGHYARFCRAPIPPSNSG